MPRLTTPEIDKFEAAIQDMKKQLLAERKKLAPEVVEDYGLTRVDGSKVPLSELFGGKQDLIVVHNMGRSCPYCTLWADGLNGFSRHLSSRAGFVLVSPDPPLILKEFAASRGWDFDFVSSEGSDFTEDMGYWSEADGYWPGFSTFRMGYDGKILRVGCDVFGPGDEYCSVWPIFDLLEGGTDGWEPKYTY